MSAYSVRKKEINANNNTKVEVLYQHIGGKWYAFSEQNDEVFFTEVPDEVIAAQNNAGNTGTNSANS
jgi:hypothetical protein